MHGRCAQEALLWEPESSAARADTSAPAPEILRAKGVLCLASEPPRQRILQVVRQLYEITDAAAPMLLDEPGVSRLVLIGRGLNAAALAESLRAGGTGAFRVDTTS